MNIKQAIYHKKEIPVLIDGDTGAPYDYWTGKPLKTVRWFIRDTKKDQLKNGKLIQWPSVAFYYAPPLAAGQTSEIINDKKKTLMLDTVVAETFCGNPKNYKFFVHLDGNRMNCAAENLEWYTSSPKEYKEWQDSPFNKDKNSYNKEDLWKFIKWNYDESDLKDYIFNIDKELEKCH